MTTVFGGPCPRCGNGRPGGLHIVTESESIKLTKRELDVIRYLVNTRLGYAEIAREMFVTINTVKTHAWHAYRKLGVRRRIELIDRCNELDLRLHLF